MISNGEGLGSLARNPRKQVMAGLSTVNTPCLHVIKLSNAYEKFRQYLMTLLVRFLIASLVTGKSIQVNEQETNS
jgi:hypothetical protein